MTNRNPKRKKIWFQTSFPPELDPSFAMPHESLPNTPKGQSNGLEQSNRQSSESASCAPEVSSVRRRREPPPCELPERVHRTVHGDERMVGIGSHGGPIGEDHPAAKYTDYDIDCVFALRDAGWSIREIGRKLDMPHSTVHAIVQGKMRSEIPVKWRRAKQ